MYVFYLFFIFFKIWHLRKRCFFDLFSYTGYTDISCLLQNKSAEALINLCIERREKVHWMWRANCVALWDTVWLWWPLNRCLLFLFPSSSERKCCVVLCFCFCGVYSSDASSWQTSGKAQFTVQLLEAELGCLLVCKGHIGKSIRPEKKSVCFQKVEARNRRSVFPSCPPVAFPQIPWLSLWFVFTFQENRSHHPQGVCRIGFPTHHTPAPPHLCLEY